MHNDQIKVLSASLKRLLRRGATKQVTNIIKKTHMADLSSAFEELSPDNREKLFKLIKDPEEIGLLFSTLDESFFLEFVKTVEFEKLVEIFDHMPSDAAACLLNLMDDEISDKILSKMKKEESDNVEQLMSYDDNTAGSLMVKDFIALEEELKAKEVIAALMGSAVPLVLHRLNIVPAVATGPFVTTSIDIVSAFCYFSIADFFLEL